MRKLFSIFALVLLYVGITFGQAQIEFPLRVEDSNGNVQILRFGLDINGTNGVDSLFPAIGEYELPPPSPTGVFDTRFITMSGQSSLGQGALKDIRGPVPASWPFTGQKRHRFTFQPGDTPDPAASITISWTGLPSTILATSTIVGGSIDFPVNQSFSGTGSITIPNIWLGDVPNLTLTINYNAIQPEVTAPAFSISPPAGLVFVTPVNVGNNAMLPVTVTNTGNAPLTITGLVSSDATQFSFTPAIVSPLVIAAGGNQVFNVTFTPGAGGPQSANLTFTHNGPGPTTVYSVQGTGYVPAPVFAVSGGPLNFGPIELGNTSTPQPLTVTNTGDAPLTVTLSSIDPQFIVSPTTLVTIPAGLNAVFNVSFHPLATGPQITNVTFTHNAGTPVNVLVQGSGFTTAPFFSINPVSLNFGQVSVGGSAILPVTVSNTGTAQLTISDIVASGPFTFAPSTIPVNIAAGGSAVFNVTFTPTADGVVNGSLTFSHNAPAGSTFVLPLQGEGRTQGGLLKFIQSSRVLFDSTYNNQDTVVLSGYTGQPLKALQFDVLIGNINGKLVLNSVSRGDNLPVSDWYFDYSVRTGALLPDGSHIDTLRVVILGNGLNVIMPGGPDVQIMKFSYDVVSITTPSAITYNSIVNVVSATYTPVVDAKIIAGPWETLNIFNGTVHGLLGDVNLDNHVNLLDILEMIDYILGRHIWNAQQLYQGDISPWTIGQELPVPDGSINVLDLAVLQNIVLTGHYPSGAPAYKAIGNPFMISNLQKMTPGMDAKLTFFLSKNGITVGLESVVKVKGVQIEMNGVNSTIPVNTPISSVFDTKVYYQLNDFLRTLTYDGQALPMDAGEYLLAKIPFSLSNPKGIEISEIIVADENNNALQKVEVEITYDEEQFIPSDYSLSQNFPNPFNPSTSVEFSVPVDGFVTIRVYDLLGQAVADLYSGNAQAGKYTLNWDGKDNSGNAVSTGNYIYRMTAGDFVQSKKMTFLK